MANDYSAELEALERAMQLAVDYGATKVSFAGLEFTLGPRPVAASSDKDITLPASTEPICRCGHDFAEHSEAGCFHGCRLSMCSPSEE